MPGISFLPLSPFMDLQQQYAEYDPRPLSANRRESGEVGRFELTKPFHFSIELNLSGHLLRLTDFVLHIDGGQFEIGEFVVAMIEVTPEIKIDIHLLREPELHLVSREGHELIIN